jgi:hypothetical protein
MAVKTKKISMQLFYFFPKMDFKSTTTLGIALSQALVRTLFHKFKTKKNLHDQIYYIIMF